MHMGIVSNTYRIDNVRMESADDRFVQHFLNVNAYNELDSSVSSTVSGHF